MDLNPLTHTLCSYRDPNNSVSEFERDIINIVGKDLSETYIDKINDIVNDVLIGKGSYCDLFNSAVNAFEETVKAYKIDQIPVSIINLFQATVHFREVNEKGESVSGGSDDMCPNINFREEFNRLREMDRLTENRRYMTFLSQGIGQGFIFFGISCLVAGFAVKRLHQNSFYQRMVFCGGIVSIILGRIFQSPESLIKR